VDRGELEAVFAVVLTVRVEVAPGAIEVGLSEHVAAGLPPPLTVHPRLTEALKPPVGVTLIVEVADPPGVPMVADVGLAPSVKPGPAFTVKETVAVWLGAGVPVMVTVEVPAGVVPLIVEIVTVSAVPEEVGVTGTEGLNAQLAPAGRPEQLKAVMGPVNPFTAVSVTA
jgi:hypothetical protein